MLRGPRGTWIPHEWWARKQGHTSRNVAEAELSALDEGTFVEAVPLQGILDFNQTLKTISILNATAMTPLQLPSGESKKVTISTPPFPLGVAPLVPTVKEYPIDFSKASN